MDSLEVLVTQTQGLSGSMSDLQSLNEQLKEAEPLLATNRGALRDVLARLDPEQHSLTWAHVLVSLVQDPAAAGGPESLLQTLQIFLDMCNPAHIRIVPEKYAALCRSFKDTILSHYGHDGAKRAVLPLMRALRKMQPSPSHLTPQHVDVFQVALLARTYGVVTPLVEEEIYDVLPKVTGVTATDFLLYCLYGGMLLIGLKKFKKALELLHYAVTTPTTEMNAIIVACYKKFVLLSLIVNGQVPQFSKYTSSSVQRSLRMHCQPYMDLASVYAGRDIGELRNAVAAHTKVLAADLNLGIAKQAVASLYRRNIQRITQTYLTLSLQDIASTVQLGSGKEAEQHVLRMIENREIFATINQSSAMVCFKEDPEGYNTSGTAARLDNDLQGMMRLAERVQAEDDLLSASRVYLSKVASREQQSRWTDPVDDFDHAAGPSTLKGL